MQPADRERIEALVERLIYLLDQDDGDPDLEAEPDLEEDPAELGIADHGALYLFEVEVSKHQEIAEAFAARAASRQFIRYATGD